MTAGQSWATLCGTWRVGIRLGRRSVRRHPGSTVLVVALTALPQVALGVAAIQQASTADNPTAFALSRVGAGVAGRIDLTQTHPIRQDLAGRYAVRDTSIDMELQLADLDEYQDRLSRVLPVSDTLVPAVEAQVSLRTPDRVTEPLTIQVVDLVGGARMVAGAVEGALPTEEGHIALGRDTAERLGVELGDSVEALPLGSLDEARTVTITGVIDAPGAVEQGVVGTRTGASWIPGFAESPLDFSWYLLGDEELDWADAVALNRLGATVTARSIIAAGAPDGAVLAPDPTTQSASVRTGLGAALVLALVAATVLLVGPAHALAGQRQRRQLALMAATGADSGALRRTMLATALITGISAGVVGPVLAVTVAAVLEANGLLPSAVGLFVPLRQLGAVAGLGVLSALAAGWLPAVATGRLDVAAALAGRTATGRSSRQVGRLRWAPIVVAPILCTVGALGSVPAAVAGVALGIIGLMLVAAPVLALLARHADRFPLALRLAVRDAARHPRRTGPVVTMIVVAVTGVTAASFVLATADGAGRAAYTPRLPLGTVDVKIDPSDGSVVTSLDASLEEFAAVGVSTILPGATTTTVNGLSAPAADGTFRQGAYLTLSGGEGRPATNVPVESVVVTDGTSAPGLDLPPGTQEAVGAGELVVTDPGVVAADGTVSVTLAHAVDGVAATVAWPARALEAPGSLAYVVAPPSLVAALGAETAPARLLITPTGGDVPTQEHVDLLRAAALYAVSPAATVTATVERGYQQSETVTTTRYLALGAGLMAIAVSWAVAALATTEQRGDLTVLGAVGASPRTRRAVASGQASVLAVYGSVVGALSGVLFAAAIVLAEQRADPTWQLVMPWGVLAVVLVATPAVAVLGARAVQFRRA